MLEYATFKVGIVAAAVASTAAAVRLMVRELSGLCYDLKDNHALTRWYQRHRSLGSWYDRFPVIRPYIDRFELLYFIAVAGLTGLFFIALVVAVGTSSSSLDNISWQGWGLVCVLAGVCYFSDREARKAYDRLQEPV